MSDGASRPPRALGIPRPPSPEEDTDGWAEVIDLVLLPLGARPTPVAYVEYEEVPRLRVLGCDRYQSCLNFVARVRWKSFHCRQCPRNPARSATRPPLGRAASCDLGD